jgi:polysaccharide export outer membrane protein
VLGQVQKPGSYEIQGTEEVTLLQAIGLAGGYTRISDPTKITVKRREGEGEKIFRFNGKKMARDDSDAAFVVRPGDVITVAESVF